MSTNKPIPRFMRLPEVLTIFPISKSTWWLGIKQGKFPKGIKLSSQITIWKVEDIQMLAEKIGGECND